jgi:uncharacterized protein (DUF4415 family)
MFIMQSTVKAGQKPSKEEMNRITAELKEAKKHPINLADYPELPAEALKEFAMQRAAKNRQKRRATVTIRIIPDCLEKYKALGKGYTGIMADVLNYAANNPEFLKQAIQ